MAKDKQPRKPRAETPKGFRDYFGADVIERRDMLAKISDVYERYGFDPLETSAVETVEALGKFLPDVDRPNEGVFGWQDEDGDWLALRYDLTAPLARVAAQFRNDLPTPYRRYAFGPVWRNEKPGPGRFRQFYQCDADTVGAPSVAADAEICAMLSDALEEVGIERGDYEIKINNRKVLNGVLQAAELLTPADPNLFEAERGIVLRAIDKLDRLGINGVRELLGPGRKDISGDFTKGAGLNELQIEKIMGFVGAFDLVYDRLGREALRASDEGDEERANRLHHARYSVAGPTKSSGDYSYARHIWNRRMIDHLRDLVGGTDAGWEGVNELSEIYDILCAQGYTDARFSIDPSVVRGLGYYTGPVYEAELTFEILDEKGRKRQFGSVAGGGRYDDLVKRFTGQAVPATGVSIGVDRLLAALRAKKLERGEAETVAAGPVVVTVMDRDRMADYMAMVGDLRRAGIRAEMYLGNPKNFGNQLKYADKRGSPIAIIQGGDEAAKGVVDLKNLVLGAVIAKSATLEEWKDRPAQETVKVVDLVAAVQKMLQEIGSLKSILSNASKNDD
ncbi:histidine--tRNA ligase [Pseudorhodobacter ferrugineus]|uniref:histidine--tRNA ligase n=1 Tax=Pseudorhodobacter ferrugineus TaxID=77008 RepID=UPI0003B633E9|nr:HisS family protein [Pseudorhodobacter ferrugineus]